MSNQSFSLKKLDKMPFTGLFIFILLKNLRRDKNTDEDELEVVEYYYMARLGEIEKLIWITLIFALISTAHLPIFFATVVALFSVRIPSGGFHSRSTWGCFFWTLFGFIMANLILPPISINTFATVAIAVFSVIICYIASPIRSIDREEFIDKSKDNLLKRFATTMTIIWFIIIFFWPNPFTTAIMWIILIQNLQLLIEYTIRNIKKRSENL